MLVALQDAPEQWVDLNSDRLMCSYLTERSELYLYDLYLCCIQHAMYILGVPVDTIP